MTVLGVSEATVQFLRLVERTNRRYAKCKANGGHVASGEVILRDVLGIPHTMQVCRRCDVPYTVKTHRRRALGMVIDPREVL